MAAPEKVKQLVSMGYTESEAEQALDIADGDMEQAVGFLLLSSSDRGGFKGAESFSKPPAVSSFPPAATMNNTPASSNLKPPPQNSTPPSNLKPPPSSNTQTARNDEESTHSEPKLELIDDYDEYESYDHLPDCEFGNITVHDMTSFQSRVSDITNYDTFGSGGSSIRSDPLVDGKKVCEIVEMGYSPQEAELALKVTGGDLNQAVEFLLLEKETREALAGEVMESFQIGGSHTDGEAREAATLFLQQEEEREHLQQAEKRLQEQERGNGGKSKGRSQTRKHRPEYTNYQTSPQQVNNVPKMVVSNTGAEDPKSRPFCTCVAASKFLNGGMVNSAYLNSIVDEGYHLCQKANDFPVYNIGKVLMRFGRTTGDLSDLGLVSSTVKVGAFEAENLQAETGFRRLLFNIRNDQSAGWEVVLMELGDFSFCICLPPKGSSNKFWLLDLVGRPEFRTEGAYARVHVSLRQLEESLEYVMKMNGRRLRIERQDFKLFVVKLVGIPSPHKYK